MKCVEVLATADLLPGMVLAEALLDEMGRVLIPAGAELSEKNIASLASRDLPGAKIERQVAEDVQETEAYRLVLQGRLDHLFRHAGSGEVSRALYQAVVDYRVGQR
ncbi:MAG: hypothetical protein BWY57_02481 [Betaproteobacteria bacterium ADurb.Bin341]|nr:MAG: hypothetical protein BWY57_02481 [Betaproteobacteria bacterium ADurb.Bin341]